MNNFNNNNENFENLNNQNDFQNYNSESVNEFSYKPENKKSKGRKILTGIIAVLSVFAIGTTSIVGYSLITGTGLGKDSSDTSLQTSQNNKSSTDSTSSSSSVDRSNLPSIIQLATPSDAMTIPDIVDKVSPSVVGISCMTSSGTVTGTGIIMSTDG